MTADGDDAPVDQLEVSAAWLRSESGTLVPLLDASADRLSAVPGLQVVVTRRRGRLRRLLGDLPYLNDLHRRTAPVDTIVNRARQESIAALRDLIEHDRR